MNQNAFNAGYKTRAVINSAVNSTVSSTTGAARSTKDCVASFLAGWNAKPMAVSTHNNVIALHGNQYKVLSHE